MNCENCGERFDPNVTNWLCPKCKTKHHCCEGEPA
jgi:Zn finger protein HypA/HybF involved in hydrogenase expression